MASTVPSPPVCRVDAIERIRNSVGVSVERRAGANHANIQRRARPVPGGYRGATGPVRRRWNRAHCSPDGTRRKEQKKRSISRARTRAIGTKCRNPKETDSHDERGARGPIRCKRGRFVDADGKVGTGRLRSVCDTNGPTDRARKIERSRVLRRSKPDLAPSPSPRLPSHAARNSPIIWPFVGNVRQIYKCLPSSPNPRIGTALDIGKLNGNRKSGSERGGGGFDRRGENKSRCVRFVRRIKKGGKIADLS